MDIALLSDHKSKIEQIAGWYFNEWADLNTNATVEDIAESIRSKLKYHEAVSLFYVALDRDDLVGVVEFKLRENKDYPQYEHWLGGLYVKPEFRGKGVGEMLVVKTKAHAKKLKLPRLYLQCAESLINMYAGFGFKVLHGAKHGKIPVTILVWEESQQKRT